MKILASIKDYISELNDMEHAISNLTWELEPTRLSLMNEAGQKISEAVELLNHILQAPEKTAFEC